ncbi:MAG: hypothetical protein APG08_01397 [Candidatus Methanofastidiosum methylothiophilum]|jgi:hypothetical protein|uniref:Uncharacterized protein n=1 Tax=Candidatus Methanofastidiosum methylothiophilum TaxID=1705564 RepID=A0A150JF22_9EURY|nr:MAG: hypothetical protein AN188_00016 [Candidatus Methanofastidiosum methylthiophilus]OQC50877.1 MAG: hypothetical protein BWX56_01225 [Euryarchaeota archaeon ADurb.Bin023]HNV94140.1 hypothetical protein [Methanofastidiosum sp.]KYC55836.1 MAG: hypothetical protein APG08_01397 [Candidatus Methanofastidiosum methylthiophilus]KYC56797.1 MAG: hypothetical protein APG09_01277 [Candidatus Methanofastidiosum methylthiophilus]
MDKLKFPKPYKHEHEKICDVNELYEERQTFGEKPLIGLHQKLVCGDSFLHRL